MKRRVQRMGEDDKKAEDEAEISIQSPCSSTLFLKGKVTSVPN
jgi:hypothetical protein